MVLQTETYVTETVSRKRTISPPVVTAVRIGVETVTILAAAFLSSTLYHLVAYGSAFIRNPHLELGAALSLIFAIISFFRDDYRAALHLSGRKALNRVVQGYVLAFVAVIVLAFLTKSSDGFSRGAAIVFFLMGLVMVPLSRGLVSQAIRHATRSGWFSAGRVMIVGFGEGLAHVLANNSPREQGYDVIAVERLVTEFNDDMDAPGLGIDAIVEKARYLQPDTIMLTLPWSRADLIEQCVRAFMNLPVRVELAPERVLERYSDLRLGRLGSMLTLNVLRPPMGHTGHAAKRLFDVVAAGTGLLVLSPLLLLVALLIKLDSRGPVLFRQNRYGFNQRPFRIWKFRSMRVQDDGPVVVQASRDDGRITRVGRFIRKWNLDELPQLINVVTGDMSLVGPRPHAVAHNRLYERKIDLYARRHNVLPGITGWAQVNGFRGATDDDAMQGRVDLDLYYLDNWSLGFDIIIIFMTIFSKRSYRNAY
ncbi:MAG: undecaprenyl-phosphate glucose phosphotransferase [Proteobacteria bacterium]|nr:undecaprenyl-phosphate glucose phosphotransferase [Pseudomonadota bacterium]